jgi:succinate dehydrogenase / fumarate reductase membrane anchor subunit
MKGSTTWKIQRLAALVMLFTFGYVGFFLLAHQPLTYALWTGFMHQTHIQVLMTISLFALIKHASIGLDTILTDYVKCSTLRHCLYAVIIFALIVSVFTLLAALWRPVL